MQAELHSAPDGLFAGRTPRIHVNGGSATVAVQGKQASTTNVITVRVTDDGRTNMTDTASFTVVVGDCVQPSLGQQILLAGQSGRVPINLISRVPLTNLGMTLVSPPGHFVSFALEPIVPEICSNTVTPTTNGWYLLNLVACPNQFLIGTQQVAWLNFTTVSNQSSAFVGLSFRDLQGYQPGGTPVANFAPQSGRIVVLGEEPLLEMVRATNQQPVLVIYGKPSSGYAIQWRTNLALGSWQSVLTNLTITTNLFLDFTPPPGSGPVNYYLALRTTAPIEKIIGLAQMNGTNVLLSSSGVAARPYRVQFTPTLSPSAWQTIGAVAPALDGQTQFTDTNGSWQTQRYYRFIWP